MKRRSKKVRYECPGSYYQAGGLKQLDEALYFIQCSCKYCLELRHNLCLLMAYLKTSESLRNFLDKTDILYLQEGINYGSNNYHNKLVCKVINDVVDSMDTLAKYGLPDGGHESFQYPSVK